MKQILLVLVTLAFIFALVTVGLAVFLVLLLLLPIFMWWLKRKMRRVEKAFMQEAKEHESPETGGVIIETDYKVVDDE